MKKHFLRISINAIRALRRQGVFLMAALIVSFAVSSARAEVEVIAQIRALQESNNFKEAKALLASATQASRENKDSLELGLLLLMHLDFGHGAGQEMDAPILAEARGIADRLDEPELWSEY